jgi:hypothetical protein
MKRIRDRQLRTSRLFLVVTGGVLLAFATAAALLAGKVIDRVGDPLDAHTTLLNASGQRLLKAHQLAFQLGAVVVAIVFVSVGAAWLRQQIPAVRRQEDVPLDIGDAGIAGRNTIAGDALAHALESDLERSAFVARARAELRSGSEFVRIRLDVDEEASVDEIVATVVDPAIARIVTVAELATTPRVVADIRPVAVAASPS